MGIVIGEVSNDRNTAGQAGKMAHQKNVVVPAPYSPELSNGGALTVAR
jgi:hypothetical protein